jgi:hypothetical protein
MSSVLSKKNEESPMKLRNSPMYCFFRVNIKRNNGKMSPAKKKKALDSDCEVFRCSTKTF